jgi:glycosyltransferase involved in cell wall biosynthesis
MWEGKTLSVVLMTYAERDSIRGVIEGFFDTGVVDEAVVVNNNAQQGTSEEVAKTHAREVFEPKQGYGNAIRRGLREARGELILLAEPDGTFVPRDVFKMLSYSGECEAVLGTRTTRELIWSGANMGLLLRWGNWAVAKMVEVMFNTSHISDMGCSLRLFNRRMADYVAENMTVGGSHAGAEILMLVLVSGARFVEIPVNYLPRVGRSSVTGNPLKALVLGLRMIALVISYRVRAPRRLPRPEAMEVEAAQASGLGR